MDLVNESDEEENLERAIEFMEYMSSQEDESESSSEEESEPSSRGDESMPDVSDEQIYMEDSIAFVGRHHEGIDIENLPAYRTHGDLFEVCSRLATMCEDGNTVRSLLSDGIKHNILTEITRPIRFRGRRLDVTLLSDHERVEVYALSLVVIFLHNATTDSIEVIINFEGITATFDFSAEDLYTLEVAFRIVKISGMPLLYVLDSYFFDHFNRFASIDDLRQHFCLPLWCVRDTFRIESAWEALGGVMYNLDDLRILRKRLGIDIQNVLEDEDLDIPDEIRRVMRLSLTPPPYFEERTTGTDYLEGIREFITLSENLDWQLEERMQYRKATLGSLVAITLTSISMDVTSGDLLRSLIFGDIYNNFIQEAFIFDMWDESLHIGGDHVG